MQNKELSALLEDRDPLAAQTVLELSGDSGEPASFRIDALLGAGGSSLVYRVTRLSESEGSVQGSLKEFYPCSVGGGSQDMDSLLASMSVARTPDGSLKLPREMCEDTGRPPAQRYACPARPEAERRFELLHPLHAVVSRQIRGALRLHTGKSQRRHAGDLSAGCPPDPRTKAICCRS